MAGSEKYPCFEYGSSYTSFTLDAPSLLGLETRVLVFERPRAAFLWHNAVNVEKACFSLLGVRYLLTLLEMFRLSKPLSVCICLRSLEQIKHIPQKGPLVSQKNHQKNKTRINSSPPQPCALTTKTEPPRLAVHLAGSDKLVSWPVLCNVCIVLVCCICSGSSKQLKMLSSWSRHLYKSYSWCPETPISPLSNQAKGGPNKTTAHRDHLFGKPPLGSLQ